MYAGGNGVQTFAIVTTTPNDLVSKVHDRMTPVILPRDLKQRWLTTTGAGQLMVPPMVAYDTGDMSDERC